MKIVVKYKGNSVKATKKKCIREYIHFLQNHLPLKNDVKIYFLTEREGDMTTGSRKTNNEINVLTKGRILRDILRTLGHEWVHEYQMTILKRDFGPNIGGRNENEANAISAKLIKMFEKKYPNLVENMYE